MSDRWSKLRDRFKAKDMDLDAEFEKFLNESMSDESSMGSPRMKARDLKSNPVGGHMPWWAEEDDDDDEEKKREVARQSWMKTKISEQEVKQQEQDAVDDANTPNVPTPHPNSKGSMTALSVGSYVDSSALSMSKDSLEEGLIKSIEKRNPPPEETLKRLGSEEFEDTFSYSDVTKTGTSGSHSPPVPQSFPTKPGSMGLDTMNELADKEKFFHDVEEEMSAVDYKKKLAEISTSDSVTMDRRADDRFQATGVELGDSIFNMTGTANQMNRTEAEDDVGNEDIAEEYSDNFEDERSPEVEAQPSDLPRPSAPEPPETAKPSMLSKVSLMESLDSTLETKRPAAAFSLISQQKAEAASEVSDDHHSPGSDERGPSMLRTGLEYDASGSTREIHELQAALQAAQLTTTDTGSKYSGNFELPPTSRVIQVVEQSDQGQIVIEKNDQGETRARGFDLQPVVTGDWRDTNNTMASRRGNDGNSFFSEDDERGFGLKPVRDGRAFKGSLQDNSQDVGSSVDSTHMELATGALEPRGLDLSPAVPADTGDRGFDLQPAEDSRGFNIFMLRKGTSKTNNMLSPLRFEGSVLIPNSCLRILRILANYFSIEQNNSGRAMHEAGLRYILQKWHTV